MKMNIRLPGGSYEYDNTKQLGKRGGFGQVFLGKNSKGEEIAVKKLHLSAADAAHRELSVAKELKGRTLKHIVPFIDSGEDANTGDYFVVMPRAIGSLSSAIESNGVMPTADAARCMKEIVDGLIEVGDLVHRDLKPDNILFHIGSWKIADFGIARFIEEATAANTLKDFLSRDYAAPEQWRNERSTHATDLYALGCIGFFLLTGKAPYDQDHSNAHQYSPLPAFDCQDHRLRNLITMMTRKSPESRPTLSRVNQLLSSIISSPAPAASSGLGDLANAAAQAARRDELIQTQESAARTLAADRQRLAKEAYDILKENSERLWGKIHDHAPNAVRQKKLASFECGIGFGSLTIDYSARPVPPGAFARSKCDVIAQASVEVNQSNPSYLWSASLWYAKLNPNDGYRWYEVSYWRLRPRNGFEPFAASLEDADNAASNTINIVQKAFGPVAIDDEKEDEFHERWTFLLARAATGRLRAPTTMPIHGWPPSF